MHRPARQLAAVVLHLRRYHGAALACQLGAPIQRAAAALRLVVELVERFERQELVLATDVVLDHGVELRAHDQVQRVLVLFQREVEAPVLVRLRGERLRLFGRVVKWVLVRHLDPGRLGLGDDLVGKVVVDKGRFEGEGAGEVDGFLVAFGRFERRVGGVLVDADHVEGGAVALVQVDFVAVARDEEVPRVDGARGAHEHGEDVVGREDGRLVLFGQFLDDGVGGRGDVVGGAVDDVELALRVLDRGLVVRSVVVVQEAVRLNVLAAARLQVELGQPVEVDLFEHGPVRLDVDR